MNKFLKARLSGLIILTIGTLNSCKERIGTDKIEIEVKNPLDFDREELVGIPIESMSKLLETASENHLRIKKNGSKSYLRTQWVDNDCDGKNDELLFQASTVDRETASYSIVVDSINQPAKSEKVTFSRFVPERTDDYTWENDKVAFRTYGPEAQRLVENDEPGGTLSSGIDLWLKKVDYSIIDKWYAKNIEEVGYYHIDHGEGYDPYHVGKSRGTGGTGIWENDSLLVSKNFIAYRTIANGPLRTIFELDYAPWGSYGIKETKRISLDLGSNFSKFEIHLRAEDTINNYTVGITLHEQKGNAKMNTEAGWFSHWEPIDNFFVGEGIVINPKDVKDAFIHKSDIPDQSQLLIVTNPNIKTLTYYAGFSWMGSGQVSNTSDWENMLQRQVEKIENPLQVVVKKQ